MGVEQLAASLTRLQDALAEVRLPLDVPEADEHRELVRAQSRQIEDYVLPRLRRLDAPLLTVVGGSTGAGKSTLVNSLVGRVVTTPGVIRPTTRSSVLVHHPEDARWFESGQILPGLARSDAPVTDPRVLQLVPEPSLPKGLAILDAPDVDSVVAQNRTLAAQLLAAADLWLFVTSAARYADAVPWQYLRAAARRKAVVAVVLDRVPPAAMSDVPPHLGQMMSQRGLSASPLFAVPETTVDEDGLLPNASVAPIRGWLADLAEDTVRRNQVVLQTLDGAIESLADHGPALVAAVAAQTEALDTLQADAEKSFAEAARSVAAQTADGTLLRGEVLARWQDFVGTGEFFRSVEKRIGLFRDRLVQVAKGEPKRAQDVQLAVESGLEVLVREEGEFAARRVVSAWEAHPAGRQLLDRDGALGKVSLDFSESAARVIRQWQGDVLELVGSEGKSKKSMARFLALGVNGAGVALMVFIFSQTGGLVGAEVGVAGGTALLAQRVLEAVFGEDAVRRLAKEAKAQLDSRVEGLMAIELSRFEKLIDEVEVRSQQGEELRAAVLALETERVAEDRYIREANVGAGLPEPSLPEPVEPEPTVAGEAESADVEAEAVETDPGEPGADQEAVAPAASAETPQRFVAGDTGLLPGLVSAQLSALAAGAVRHGEDDESDVQLTDEDDFDLPPHQVGPLGESEGESDGDAEEAAVADVASADWAESDGEPESLAAESVAEGESLDPDSLAAESVDDESVDGDEDTSADPDSADPDSADADSAEAEPAATGVAERPIPVPAGLAALAAEAVRRPGEPRQEVQDSAELAAHESEQESASGGASAAEPTEPAEPPAVSLPAAPVLPSAPLPSEVAVGTPESVEAESVEAEQAEAEQADAEQADAEQADAEPIEADVTEANGTVEAPAMALPTPPVLPSAPISFSPVEPADGSTSWANPAGGPAWPASPASAARRAVAGPTLPSVPLPAAPAPVTYADVSQDATPSLLVPPDQIPPAPPVPQWPEPEPEPETESIAGVSGEETS